MRAVVITKPGGLDVLSVADRAVRQAGPGEVRIAVKAAAVNPTDIGLREGAAGDLEPPLVPGMDAAGTVESVGAGVDRLSVGEQVMAAVSPRRPEGGAQAELIVVPAASVVAIPDGATLPQAATLPMNGLTALLGLELLDLAVGQSLAVSGGAGLLASYVIALAKVRGLRVIGSDADASLTARQADLRGPAVIVVGSEGQGLGPSVRRRCDTVVRIPMLGHVTSLNASVAGSILLYETASQRGIDRPTTVSMFGPDEAPGSPATETADTTESVETTESASDPGTAVTAPAPRKRRSKASPAAPVDPAGTAGDSAPDEPLLPGVPVDPAPRDPAE